MPLLPCSHAADFGHARPDRRPPRFVLRLVPEHHGAPARSRISGEYPVDGFSRSLPGKTRQV